MNYLTQPRAAKGFALPTVVIATVVMFMILVAAVGSISSTRVALDAQFYESLQRDALESAGAQASECLAINNYAATWSSANPLRPNTNCNGGAACTGSPSCYVVNTPTYNSSYTVGAATSSGSGVQTISITSTVNLTGRSNSSVVVKSLSKVSKMQIGGQVSTNTISFGYSDCGTFFVTRGNDNVGRAVGANSCGQLGNGTVADATSPSAIALPNGVPLKAAPATAIYSNFLNVGRAIGAIGADGNAYFSGSNDYGQQGIGSTLNTYQFQKFILPTTPAGNPNIPSGQVQSAVFLAAIDNQSYVITDKGYVYAAGYCGNGQTGNGTSGVGCQTVTPTLIKTGSSGVPWPNPNDPSTLPLFINGDSAVRDLLMHDGSVYAWGQSDTWALGVNVSTAVVPNPTKIMFWNQTSCTKGATCPFGAGPSSGDCIYGSTQNHCVLQVIAGRTAYLLLNDGTVWSAGGDNGWGMLGVGSTNALTGVFHQITAFPADGFSHKVKQIHSDAFELVMLTTDGNVYTVGKNDTGVAGCGTPVSGSTGACPTIVTTPIRFNLQLAGVAGTVNATSIYHTSNQTTQPKGSSSYYNTDDTFIIASNGRVYGAGSNEFGQLGNGCVLSTPIGPTSTCSGASVIGTPVAMQIFDGTNTIPATVQSGRGTTVIKSTAGTVYTVGLNDYGQLGNGTTNNSSVPKANIYTNSIKPIAY